MKTLKNDCRAFRADEKFALKTFKFLETFSNAFIKAICLFDPSTLPNAHIQNTSKQTHKFIQKNY